MDLIKCPDCGEMYSSSYPRCPFCEEDGDSSRKIRYQPKRHIADKRKAQSARGALIAVLVLVLALLSFYLFGDSILRGEKKPDENETPPAQDTEPNVPASNPGVGDDPFYEPGAPDAQGGKQQPGTDAPPAEPPAEENVDVSGAKLNRDDFTLSYSGEQFTIRLSGTEATPHWSIDNGNVARLAADGTVTALANGTTTVHCRVGGRDLTCTVRVRNTGSTAAAADAPTVVEPVTPTEPAAPDTTAPGTTQTPAQSTHVDASSLSVKTNYGTLLQKDPGSGYPDCTVRIGGDPIALIVVGTDVPVSSWTSDRTSVVQVGNDGKLTPVSAGTAHVTATVGDAQITCIIRVH